MKPLLLLALLLASPARADVTLGAVLSLTGSGAGLGVPARNTIELLPKTMAGEPVRWVVLDDGSDSTAVRAVRKLVEEERVDAILGPCTSPASVAVRADAAAQGIPIVAEARYAPGDSSVSPQVLRLSQAKAGAVFVAASAAPAPVIELRALGFAGPICTVTGIAGPDAIRVGGRALAAARPGTPEFRTALRDAMERVRGLAGAEGMFSLSPADHSGAEPASQVLIEICGGGYRLALP